MSLKRKAATTVASDAKKPKANSSITAFFRSPNPTPANTKGSEGTSASPLSASSPTKIFNKDIWVSSLSADQKKLLKLEIDTLHESWLKELKDDIVKPSFLELKRFLEKEKANGKVIFPPERDIYSWSRFTPLNNVKAVILGQDPYHNTSQAHGLSFSVNPPTTPPPSLRNIFQALKNDYPKTFRPPPDNTGRLTPWARQGVLMLNTCLTVRAHEANSHANRGWEALTQRVIDVVARKRTGGVVFLAWGTPAGKRVVKVDKTKHQVLMSVHPSPLSASRGWFDCGHFRKTNEWLVSRYGAGAEIDWDLGKIQPENEELCEEKKDIGTESPKLEVASQSIASKESPDNVAQLEESSGSLNADDSDTEKMATLPSL